MDVGQVNRLNYNWLDNHYSSLMRNGRPMNDLLDGSLDFNLLSRNEIEEVELTNGYGNAMYNYSNFINIIEHQKFQFKPYSEISYWGDRFDNEYFDGNFHVNLKRFLNFNFGINKQSYTGYYNNSDFDKWLGRFNFNYIGSPKFNAFLYLNYSRIQRGLNEGIDLTQLKDFSNDSLYEQTIPVVNSDAYEIRERFDIDAGMLWAYGKKNDNFTKLQFFTSNSFRKYRDEENRPNPNGIYFKDDSHWIDYGVKLTQNFNYALTHSSSVNLKSEAEYDFDVIFSNMSSLKKSTRIYLMQGFDYRQSLFSLNGYFKLFRHEYVSDKFYWDAGLAPSIDFKINNLNLKFFAAFYLTRKLPTYQQYFLDSAVFAATDYKAEENVSLTGGIKINSGSSYLKLEYANGKIKNPFYRIIYPIQFPHYDENKHVFNAELALSIFNFDFNAKYTYYKHTKNIFDPNPEHNANIELSYHNVFFKNKLEVKIGAVSRLWSEGYAITYSGYFNEFSSRMPLENDPFQRFTINKNATLDFFIIGKIDKAIFGITLENLFNRPSANTLMYPVQKRGGIFNVISRFNITWYFLN